MLYQKFLLFVRQPYQSSLLLLIIEFSLIEWLQMLIIGFIFNNIIGASELDS